MILEKYEALANKIAAKFKSKDSEEYKDALQHAKLGILHAYRNYDPDKGVKFITYAWNQGYYAVKKYLRSDLGLIHIPHNSDEKAPTYVELPHEAVTNDLEVLDNINIKIVLNNAMHVLSEEEKKVLVAIYENRDKAEDVAAELGWNDASKVYKTTQKALKKLKKHFDNNDITLHDLT